MIKNNNLLLSIGMFSLVLAILLGRYVGPGRLVNFLEGFFYGLSVVLNMAYLIRISRNK